MLSPENANMRSLLKKALSYASGDGSSALVNIVVFTILLRFLSPSDFGYLSVGQAVSTWVQPVLYMGANLVAVRLIAADPQHTPVIARRMIAVRFAAFVAVSACTVAVALHTSDRSLRSVLLAYSVLFFLYPAQPDFIAIGLHRSRVYTVSRWLASACFISLVLMLTRITIRAWMVPLAYAAGLSLSAAYGYAALWPALRISGEMVDIGVRVLFRGAIVVVAAQFLQMGQASLDVILLTMWKVPVVLIGDYNAMSRLTSAGCLPFVALIYALAPVYVKQLAGGDMARIKALELRFRMCLLAAGAAAAIVIAAIGPRVVELVGGRAMPTAHQLAPVFAVICLVVALHNSYTAILVYGGAAYLYLATYAAGAVSTLVAAVLLIPRFGTGGAALSQLAGLAVILAASYLFHRQFLRQLQTSQVVVNRQPETAMAPVP